MSHAAFGLGLKENCVLKLSSEDQAGVVSQAVWYGGQVSPGKKKKFQVKIDE